MKYLRNVALKGWKGDDLRINNDPLLVRVFLSDLVPGVVPRDNIDRMRRLQSYMDQWDKPDGEPEPDFVEIGDNDWVEVRGYAEKALLTHYGVHAPTAFDQLDALANLGKEYDEKMGEAEKIVDIKKKKAQEAE